MFEEAGMFGSCLNVSDARGGVCGSSNSSISSVAVDKDFFSMCSPMRRNWNRKSVDAVSLPSEKTDKKDRNKTRSCAGADRSYQSDRRDSVQSVDNAQLLGKPESCREEFDANFPSNQSGEDLE